MTEAQDQRGRHWNFAAPFWAFKETHFLSNYQGPHALKLSVVKKALNPYRKEILESGERILDIGSGGLPEMYLPEDSLKRTTALDISEEMLGYNRSKEKVLADANCGFPFDNEIFGFVTMFFINRYLNNQEYVLGEVIRVLKPGGRFIMLDFNTNKHSLEKYLFEPEGLLNCPALAQVEDVSVQVIFPGKEVLDGDVSKKIFKTSLFTGKKLPSFTNPVCSLKKD